MSENQTTSIFEALDNCERANQLLIRCINFQKHFAYSNISAPEKSSQEATAISKLQDRCCALCQLSTEPFIDVDLFIEKTSKSSSEPIKFKCKSSWSIYTVKQKVIKQLNLSVSLANLFLICKGQIVKDWHNLKSCGILNNGDFFYIYVVEEEEENKDVFANEDSDSSKEMDQLMRKLELSDTEPCTSTNKLSASLNTSNQTNFCVLEVPVDNKSQDQESLHFEEVSKRRISRPIEINDDNKQMSFCKVSLNHNFLDGITSPNKDIFENVNNQSEQKIIGWQCASCTYINEPTRPGCKICSYPSPANYIVPTDYIPSSSESERLLLEKQNETMTIKMQEEAKKVNDENRKKNYQNYLSVHEQNLLENSKPVDCSICLTEADIGEAVHLADCLHVFCKQCLSMHIMLSDQLPVKCPYVDENYDCSSNILEREIRALLPSEKFQAYLRKSLGIAESHATNSFHCKTPDCYGWCEYDDGVNKFECPVCEHINCLTCKAIHENMTCKEYQEELFSQSSTNKEAKKTKKLLKKFLKKKEAMHCPNCNIIILKKDGCDWLRCTMCSLEICWVTQKSRWGPDGVGDTSDGCQCGVNGKKCHPLCINCH